ncbi:MAG: hypothetical protein ACREJQ_05640 [bacterium]
MRKTSWFMLVAGWMGVMLVAAAQKPGASGLIGDPPPVTKVASAFLNQAEANAGKQRYLNTAAINAGFSRYGEVELTYPTNLAQLCASPYMAVDCAWIINPYTQKQVEARPGSPGDISIDINVNRLKVTHYYLKGGNISKWVANFGPKMDHDIEQRARPSAFVPYSTVRPLSYNERLATSVGRYLGEVLWQYTGANKQPCPASITEILAWNDRLDPFTKGSKVLVGMMTVEHLRNGYSGGYAMQVNSPSPGNFGLTCAGSPARPRLEVYGDDGRLVFVYDRNHLSDGFDGPRDDALQMSVPR